MEKHSEVNYRQVLPTVLTENDLILSRLFLDHVTPAALAQTAEDSLRTFEYNGRPFQMAVVDPAGEKDDDAVVATFTEFGTALPPRFVAKSLLTRQLVNPNAALVMQPTPVTGQNYMNFSHRERTMLLRGDLGPLTGRMGVVMGALHDPTDVTLSGISQGATVALAFAADQSMPAAAVSAMEIPSVVERSPLQMGADFMFRSGDDLEAVISANFDNKEAPLARLALRDAGMRGLLPFFAKVVNPNTLSMMGAYTRPMAEHDILFTLGKGGSVVHSYGDQAQVSPKEANDHLAKRFASEPKYESHVLRGMGHTATDLYVLSAVLARRARDLKTAQ